MRQYCKEGFYYADKQKRNHKRNSEGIELTKEEAEAYLAELEDFELDSDVLQKVAGGGVYDTVSTIIKEVPNVVKNI